MSALDHRPMYGESGYARNQHDAYWTPAWCTRVLLKHFEPEPLVWEPACGQGHISKVLCELGFDVISTDLHDHGYGTPGTDFLDAAPRDVGSIITNPPYEISDEFAERACGLMKSRGGSVAMLLRNEWDSAKSRTKLLSDHFRMKLVLTKRPQWSENSKASPRHNFAWFVWDFSFEGVPQITWGHP
jgi:hypothetical protein